MLSTRKYKHTTENFTTKIVGASRTYCAAQYIHLSLTELVRKEQHFKISQSRPSTFLQPSTNNAVLSQCNITIADDHSIIMKQILEPRFIIYFVTEAGFE